MNPVFKQTGWFQLLDNEGYPGSLPPWGTLNAIDLNTGKTKWRVALGEYEQLIKKGFPPTGTENIGGPTVTAGGVIFVSGTKDKMLRVFDVENGDELWRWKLPFFGTSQPITYKINGEQYVFIVASGGGKLRDFDKNIKAGNSFLSFKIKEL